MVSITREGRREGERWRHRGRRRVRERTKNINWELMEGKSMGFFPKEAAFKGDGLEAVAY